MAYGDCPRVPQNWMQPDAPIYLPREADKTAGESVKSINIVTLN